MADETTPTNTSTVEVTEEKEPQAPSQTDKPAKTEKDKLVHTLKGIGKRAAELGVDPAEVLGLKPQMPRLDDELQDDKPLTVKDYRELQKKDAHETALQKAQRLPDDERDEVIRILSTRIVPSGDADEDLRLARAAVNSERNAKIVEDLTRKGTPRTTAAGGSASASVEDEFTPTQEEAQMMATFGLTKEKILAARERQKQHQGPTAV